MSGADTPQGPGWWQASDGRWYAPEQVPSPQSPVPPPFSQPTTPGGNTDQAGEPGFFARLFDVSMKSFITPSIIKVIFIVGIVAVSLGALVLFVAGVQGDDSGWLIVLAPFYWFLGVLYLRVILEVIVVLFRIEENTRSKR